MRVAKLIMVIGIGLSTSLLIPGAVASAEPYGRGGYMATFPATEGSLTADQTVASIVCTKSALMISEIQLTPTPAYSGVQYRCANGVPKVQAIAAVGGASQELTVLPGDTVRTVITTGTGPKSNQVSVRLDDLTTPGNVEVQRTDTVVPTGIAVNLGRTDSDIPMFKSIRYSDVTFGGVSLSALPDLNPLVMTDSQSRTMVQTSGITENGKGFGLYFVRRA